LQRITALGVVLLASLALASSASAHSSISPPVARAETLQPFTLELQAEEESARTTGVEVTFPDGFDVETFAASPGWKRSAVADESGGEERVLRVTWTGGEASPRDDPVFRFTGTLEAAGSYGVKVRQVYSNGSVEEWTGPEASEKPAAFVEAVSSIGGGGGTSLVTWIALALAAVAVVLGVAALAGRGGRELA